MSSDRIPDCLMNRSMAQMVTANRADYQRSMEQIASGSNYLKRSDDPEATGKIQALDNVSASYSQWTKNINTALSWEEASDSSVQSITSTLQWANEIIATANSGISDSSERKTIATEINTIIESLTQYGNARHMGIPMFSGTATPVDKNGNTVDDPFTVDRDASGNISSVYFLGNSDPAVYPDTQTKTIVIGDSSTVNTGMLGEGNNSLFQFSHRENLGTESSPDWQNVDVRVLDELISFRDNLLNTTDLPDETNCARIQAALDNVLERSVVCYSRQNRLNGAASSMSGLSAVANKRGDDLGSIDVSKATIKLNEVQTALQSSISMLDMIQKMAIQNFT